jgi:lipopolysaccharide O-acetyltransferase
MIHKKDGLQRSYPLRDILKLGWCVLRCKLLDKRIRIIRRPFVLRGRKYVDFGKGLTTGHWCRFEVFPKNNDSSIRLKFGNNIQLNDFVHISVIDSVEIGDNCLLASHIYISDNSHGRYEGSENDSSPFTPPAHREYITSPVKIGKNCWLGEGVIVMPGVTIGDGCIIGAHSVVKHDIPPASIAVGSPARIVKRYNFEIKCWEKISSNSIR